MRVSTRKAQKKRKQQTEDKKEWKAHSALRERVHDELRDNNIIPSDRIKQIDVARHGKLKSRASYPQAPEVLMDGSRGLAIVDDAN